MSNSDFDSDGFESAEDDDFEPPTSDHSDRSPPTTANETRKESPPAVEKPKHSIKAPAQPSEPAKSAEKSALLPRTAERPSETLLTAESGTKGANDQGGWDDDDGDWGWNDDNDTKDTPAASAPSSTAKTADKAVTVEDKLKALDVQDDWNDDGDDWGWNDDNDDNNDPKAIAKPKIRELPLQSSVQSAERPLASALDALQNRPTAGPDNAAAWSPWSGMVSFLSTASTNVATFTSHVSSVIESNIGVPDPESFAQQQAKEKSAAPTPTGQPASVGDNEASGAVTTSPHDAKQTADEKLLNLGSFVSNVTSISNRVISGGLDTLEGIGKKTMTILQENDAGLISKRRLLGLDNPKPVLSQVLREAKEKSEEMEKTMNLSQKRSFRKQLHFETLFDDYHGLVHLEALEMLSKQASMKLQTLLMPLTGNALNELQQTMSSVSELCELNEADLDETPSLLYDATELDEKLKAAVEDFDVPMDFGDILETWRVNHEWLQSDTDEHQAQQIHDNALKCLAKTSALAINKYHKLAELLLIKDHHSTVNESDCLVQLTNTFCWHLSGIATFHSDKLTNITSSDPEIQANNLITNIFLEGSKSASYIQNGFQLFVPILQVGAV